jgi:hypothetical protein
MDEEVEKLKAENDALRKRMEKLEEQVNPPPREPWTHPRYDPTAGMSMPLSAIKAMMDAVPESVMRGLVNDAFKPNPVTGGSSPQPTSQVKRGTGWQEPVPVESPPGIKIIDAMMDAQDERDKAERMLKAALMKRE